MKKTLILLPIIVIFISSACNTTYMSNSVNVPLFTEKNEKQINVLGNHKKYELQTAYSITDKYGALLNGYSSFGSFSGFDFAFGRFNLVGGNHQLETFLGYGEAWYGHSGYSYLTAHQNYEDCHIRYRRFFGQIHYGIPITDKHRIAVVFRPSFIYYSKYNYLIECEGYDGWPEQEITFSNNVTAKYGYALDPALCYEFTQGFLCFNMQIGYSFLYTDLKNNYEQSYPSEIFKGYIKESNLSQFTWSIGLKAKF